MSKKELIEMAKEKGVKRYQFCKKAELAKLLNVDLCIPEKTVLITRIFKRQAIPIKLICKKTGYTHEFQSAYAAAKWLKNYPSNVAQAHRRSGSVAGYHVR